MIPDLLTGLRPHSITALMFLIWVGSVILIHLCARRPRMPPYQATVLRQIMAKAAVSFSRLARVLLWLIATQAVVALNDIIRATPSMKTLFCDSAFHEALTIFCLSLGLAYGFRTYRRLNCRHVFASKPRFGALATGYVLLAALSYSTLHIAAHGGFA